MLANKHQKCVLLFIILTGLCSGFDLGVISGTLPLIKQEFGLNPLQLSEIAGVVFFGALLSKLVSGFLMDLIGRRNTILFGSFLFIISIFLMILSKSFYTLLFSRLFQGISIGFLLTTIPIYIVEASRYDFRGRMMGVFQLSLVSGVFIANLMASFFAATYGWRFIFATVMPFAITLFLMSFWVPYSPFWLYSKGKAALANKMSARLFPGLDISHIPQKKVRFSDFILALKDYTNAKYLILIALLATLNGFVGINLFISYGPTIFGQLLPNMSQNASHYGAVLTLVNLLATIGGIFLVDRIGRRKLVMIGLSIAYIATLITIISLFYGFKLLGLTSMIVIVFGGAIGPGVCIWLILSETLPVHLRAIGISIALVSKALLESMFISSFLELVRLYGYSVIFSFMASCMLLFVILVYKFLPEMANKPLK